MKDITKKLQRFIDIYMEKNVASMASSISFFTVLSITPFLLLFFAFLIVFGWQNFAILQDQIIASLGPGASLFVKSIGPSLESDKGGIQFGFLGLLTVIYAASRIVSELKDALERIFHDKVFGDDPASSSWTLIWLWIKAKLISIVAIIFCLFLFTISLVFSTILNYVFVNSWVAGIEFINYVISILFFSFIFYLMFHFLPKPKVKARFAFKTALLCSVLFHIGKVALELYFSNTSMESSYGALSSFVVILLWAYYNGLIILSSACIARAFFDKDLDSKGASTVSI